MHEFGLTVGEFKDMLSKFEDDAKLIAGGLTFYRLKIRGENLVQIEFNQVVYVDNTGKVCIE
jgi:hypothetical protein